MLPERVEALDERTDGLSAFDGEVACIGAGRWGKNLVRNFHDIGALGSIVEIDPDRRRQLNGEYPEIPVRSNLKKVLHDSSVRAVAIATPAETHGELVRQSLAAGKHVFVEKPICLSVQKGQELVEFARRVDRTLMVGHLLWYHPCVVELSRLITEGRLGEIQYIYSNRLNLGKIRREENILWSFAPHDISVILGLTDEYPDEISATGESYLQKDIVDVTLTALSFPSGIRAHVFVSWLHPYKEQKLVVVGDNGMAVFDDLEPWDEKLVVYPHVIEWEGGVPVARKAEGKTVCCTEYEPLRAECEHFMMCVSNGQKPRTDGNEAIRVLNVLNKCQAALENGNALKGPPLAGSMALSSTVR